MAAATLVTPQTAFEVLSGFVNIADPSHLAEVEAGVHRMAACHGEGPPRWSDLRHD